jgi:hypothetical protein
LQFKCVDAGGGWLVFGLPPAEAGIHPAEKDADPGQSHALSRRSPMNADVYLMCDDLDAEMKRLSAKKVEFSPVEQAQWGSKTTLRLPSGGELGLYQPRHPVANG